MGVRIQELPETTGINKEDLLIVEDGQGTKKGTVQQLDEALGVSQLKEDLAELNNSVDVIPKFIKNTVIQFTEPGLINALDGSIRTDVGTCTTLVEIPQRTKLYWSMAGKTPQTGYLYIAFYDANMKYISDIGVPTGTDNPTSGIIDLSLNEYRKAKYVRGSINNKMIILSQIVLWYFPEMQKSQRITFL